MFELKKTEGKARRGEFTCAHGTVQTPVFMNVGTCAAIKGGVNLGTRETFADIGATVLEWFGESTEGVYGNSFLKEIRK